MVVTWTEDAISQFHAVYNHILETAGVNAAKRIAHKIEKSAA